MRESGLKSGAQACINRYIVSLHAREWIEIELLKCVGHAEFVSLHAREWIEIESYYRVPKRLQSLSMRESGLK